MTLIQLKYAITVAGEHSLNEAAKKLFISQPSLSAAIHSLESEIGFEIFNRSKSGITLTIAGTEFIGYARSVIEQYEILDAKYISQINVKKRFGVSMQHYTFAVNAFVELVKQYGMDEYEFEVHETKTHEIIENVRNHKSELGILYLNDYNRAVLTKIFSDFGLQFTPLFECGIYVYIWISNSTNNFLKQRHILVFKKLAQDQKKWKEEQLEKQRRAQEKEQEAQRKAAEAAAEEAAKQAEEEAKRAEEAARCELMREHIMQLKTQRVNLIRSSETGSAEYLKARYGDYAYRSMRSVVIRELELTEEKAAAFLTENYSEDMWKTWEDDDIERLLGNH